MKPRGRALVLAQVYEAWATATPPVVTAEILVVTNISACCNKAAGTSLEDCT